VGAPDEVHQRVERPRRQHRRHHPGHSHGRGHCRDAASQTHSDRACTARTAE
jgi:hypothetical protein